MNSYRGTMKRTLALLALTSALLPAQQQQPSAQQPTSTFEATANEVMIDVVVRDKKGKAVNDLTGADFKVIDNGVEQKVLGTRVVSGAEAIEKGAKVPLDALRQVRLVTLVFEELSNEQRLIARKAALDLIKGDHAQNVFYSVMAITSQLNALQPFTMDKAKLKDAIEKATSGKYLTFPGESNRIKTGLRDVVANASNPQAALTGQVASSTPSTTSPAAGAAAGQAAGAAYLEQKTAAIMLEMLQFDATYSRDESTRISIFSLLSLVRGQYSMPGRKSVIYFTAGMAVPTNLDEPFRNVLSAANRGNISFYSVDTRGVGVDDTTEAREALNRATKNIREDTTSTDGNVSKDQMRAFDTAETSGRNNVSGPIRDLAESTGGFLVSNSNDLRPALKKINEEVNTYYELFYNPGIETYDGKFRKTRVDTERKDLVVQTRNGYFALPLNIRGPAVLPYEFALLKALDTAPAPEAVSFRAGAIRLQPGKDYTRAQLLVEVPMSGITFTEDKAAGTFKMRVSLVSLIKDAKGNVVKKFSNDLPRTGPLTVLAQAKAGNFNYKDQMDLPPGDYTVETAVIDHESGKIGVHKAPFTVASLASGVGLSNLTLVRNYQPGAKDLDPAEPFQFQGGRITPTLSGQIIAGPGVQMATFFIVHPDASIKAPVAAKVEVLVEGNVVASLDLPLPKPDALGRIPYVMSIPAEKMPAATYELHVIATQGDTKAEDRLKVQVLAKQ